MNYSVSPVFVRNFNSKQRITVNEGGSRSGKTYSILQTLLMKNLARPNQGRITDIVRKTRAEIHSTLMPDWLEILQSFGLYNSKYHNKTRSEFTINGNLIRFQGMDAQKTRGGKRNDLYINEANGLTLEDWVQLSMRTSEQIYIDYNPSEYFWCHEHIIEKRKDVEYIHSTYKDNYDFLTPEQIAEIENLCNVDDYYDSVYRLGVLKALRGTIYDKLKFTDVDTYNNLWPDDQWYGLDFGYEHHMALVEIKRSQEKYYERPVFFKQKVTDDELIKWMLNDGNISMTKDIYADPAYPASIKKLREAGFNVRKAKKDVKDGIMFTKSLDRTICGDNDEYNKQMKRYKWKQTSSGDIIEEPVKMQDDGPDASRYGYYTHLKYLIGDQD